MSNETCEELEKVLKNYILALGNLDPDSDAAGVINARIEKMFKLLSEEEKIKNQEIFNEAAQKLEEEKVNNQKEYNEKAQKLEEEKARLNTQKVIMELIKIFGPLLVSILAYAVLQRRLLKFEEMGRLTTSAGRNFHLPKFWR